MIANCTLQADAVIFTAIAIAFILGGTLAFTFAEAFLRWKHPMRVAQMRGAVDRIDDVGEQGHVDLRDPYFMNTTRETEAGERHAHFS